VSTKLVLLAQRRAINHADRASIRNESPDRAATPEREVGLSNSDAASAAPPGLTPSARLVTASTMRAQAV